MEKTKRGAIMNLKKTVKVLNRVFKEWGLEFEVELEPGNKRVRATDSLSIDGFDDDIFADFRFYESGACEYLFTFDKLWKEESTLALVNDYNANSVWFKAYLDEEYLRITHTVCNLTDDALEQYTNRILAYMVEEDNKKILYPLTELTQA